MYVGAMSFRFAATKDPLAREQARRSLNALLDLERLSGIPGFPARAMVTDEELKAGVLGFNPEARVHAPGETAKVWFGRPPRPDFGARETPAATSSTAITSPGTSITTSSPTRRRRRRSPASSAA